MHLFSDKLSCAVGVFVPNISAISEGKGRRMPTIDFKIGQKSDTLFFSIHGHEATRVKKNVDRV